MSENISWDDQGETVIGTYDDGRTVTITHARFGWKVSGRGSAVYHSKEMAEAHVTGDVPWTHRG